MREKGMKVALFASLLLTAVATAGGLAHAFSLPVKMDLSSPEYLIVQQIYRGWALLGIAIFGSLVLDLFLAIRLRSDRARFAPALTALLCMAAGQVIFWVFTYPVNQQTANWTELPSNWIPLRAQWEYSHAAGALFDLGSLSSLFLLALSQEPPDVAQPFPSVLGCAE